MFYVHKQDKETKFKVTEIENGTDSDCVAVKLLSKEFQGQFGRRDYAEHWRDYYNGDISEDKHRKFLGLAR